MADAVHLFAIDTPAQHRTIRARILERQEMLIRQLPYAEWDDFPERRARIFELTSVLEIIDEVLKEDQL